MFLFVWPTLHRTVIIIANNNISKTSKNEMQSTFKCFINSHIQWISLIFGTFQNTELDYDDITHSSQSLFFLSLILIAHTISNSWHFVRNEKHQLSPFWLLSSSDTLTLQTVLRFICISQQNGGTPECERNKNCMVDYGLMSSSLLDFKPGWHFWCCRPGSTPQYQSVQPRPP